MVIKTIMFDIGGVVIDININAIYTNFAQRVGLTPGFVIQYHKENLDKLLLGAKTLDQFWDDMRTAGADPKLDLRAIWIDEGMKNRTVNTELLAIIKKLREKYSVGTVTNITPSRLIIDEVIDLYAHFDYAVLSCEEHLKMPDPAFYRLGLAAASSQPSEAIFIDDNERYAKAARDIGINSIAYSYPDNTTLLQGLQKFDVAID